MPLSFYTSHLQGKGTKLQLKKTSHRNGRFSTLSIGKEWLFQKLSNMTVIFDKNRSVNYMDQMVLLANDRPIKI